MAYIAVCRGVHFVGHAGQSRWQRKLYGGCERCAGRLIGRDNAVYLPNPAPSGIRRRKARAQELSVRQMSFAGEADGVIALWSCRRVASSGVEVPPTLKVG